MPPGVSGSPGGAIVGAWYTISITAPHNLTSRIPDCFRRSGLYDLRLNAVVGKDVAGVSQYQFVDNSDEPNTMPNEVCDWETKSCFFTAFSLHLGWIYSVLSM